MNKETSSKQVSKTIKSMETEQITKFGDLIIVPYIKQMKNSKNTLVDLVNKKENPEENNKLNYVFKSFINAITFTSEKFSKRIQNRFSNDGSFHLNFLS